MRITRSVTKSFQTGATWEQRWNGADDGVIACWERGREFAQSDAELAHRARAGELIVLPWRGGVEKLLKNPIKFGSLQYLAMWRGLRDEDLDIDLEQEVALTCTATGMRVIYTGDRTKWWEP